MLGIVTGLSIAVCKMYDSSLSANKDLSLISLTLAFSYEGAPETVASHVQTHLSLFVQQWK